jgi:hypothetical protein
MAGAGIVLEAFWVPCFALFYAAVCQATGGPSVELVQIVHAGAQALEFRHMPRN